MLIFRLFHSPSPAKPATSTESWPNGSTSLAQATLRVNGNKLSKQGRPTFLNEGPHSHISANHSKWYTKPPELLRNFKLEKAEYFSLMTMVKDVYTKLNPQFPWQKQQSTRIILYSPANSTSTEGRNYHNATLEAHFCTVLKCQILQMKIRNTFEICKSCAGER